MPVGEVVHIRHTDWGASTEKAMPLLLAIGDLAGGNILLTADDSQPHGFSCKVCNSSVTMAIDYRHADVADTAAWLRSPLLVAH